MTKNLVVVESPAKAKTIGKYLGADYRVMASLGHIKDLPSKGLGVDVENDFATTYEVIPDTKKRNNKKTVSELKKAAKEADAIYLAADPDREGEAICQHLAEEIVPKRPKKPSYRVMFNEITKRAVQEAFKEPKQIDENLVDAQQAGVEGGRRLRRHVRRHRPVFRLDELLDLAFALDDHPQRDRLHAPRAQTPAHRATQKRRDFVADQTFEHAPRLLRVNEVLVDLLRLVEGGLHGPLRDLVEHHAV
ncbi:MAG TPA: toprim domain-containing protein, partial [Pyrinomonadaceae bacterium]|nr:toprim domain-containing protein [Pyrinomonadaceae bacterium]